MSFIPTALTWWWGFNYVKHPRPTTGFLQCFDTVGLVIRPVKIVPDMTYNVFGRTLNLAQSINYGQKLLS